MALKFQSPIVRTPQASYKEWDDFWYEPVGSSTAGVMVTREVALSIPAIWRGVSIISESIAGLPVGVFTKVNEQPIERPAPLWLRRPNPEMRTRFQLMQEMMVSLLLDANSYNLRARDNRAITTELWPQHWSRVKMDRDDAGAIRFRVTDARGQHKDYGAADMLHIPGLTLPGVFGGVSPVDKLAQALGLTLAVQEYASQYFARGTNLSGLLTLDTDPGEDAVTNLEKRMQQKLSGRDNWWKIGVLAKAAGARFIQLQNDNDKSQMLQTRVHQVIECARTLGVPPHLLFEMTKETTWGSGIESMGIGFVVYCLRPWLERLEQHLFYELPQPQYIKWNVSGLLRGDMKARFDAYRTALGSDTKPGWMTVPEVRALEEMGPMKEYKAQVDSQIAALEAGHVPEALERSIA